MSPSGSFPNLWRAQEVAEYLGKSRSWVYEASARGDLPSVKIGGSLRFDPLQIRQHFGLTPRPAVPPAKAQVIDLTTRRTDSSK